MLRKLLLLIATLIPTLTACGDAAAVSLGDAANRTLDAATARFEASISFDDLVLHATGAYDLVAGRSSIQLDVGDLLAGVGLAEGDEPLEIVVVDGDDTYMRFGLFKQLLGTDGWVRADGERVAGLLGADAGRATAGASPTVLLRALVGAADVETVGADDVRGVATTHHRGTLDHDGLGIVTEARDREALSALLEGLEDGEELVLDAWVDDAGLVRRVELARDGVAFGVELFGFGDAVDIEVPPPDEVTELPGGGP